MCKKHSKKCIKEGQEVTDAEWLAKIQHSYSRRAIDRSGSDTGFLLALVKRQQVELTQAKKDQLIAHKQWLAALLQIERQQRVIVAAKLVAGVNSGKPCWCQHHVYQHEERCIRLFNALRELESE